MKRIIVFGASGETGRYFIDYCISNKLNEQYEIIAVGNRHTDFFTTYFGLSYIQMNIVMESEFEKLPKEDVFCIVDLAGYMPARMDNDSPERMINVNLIGTLNILNYCIRVNADRILFAQSFGDIKDHSEENILLTTDLPRMFSFNSDHTVYLIAKNAAVDLIEYYHQHYGLKRFIFRLPTIYSYGKDRTFYRDGKECPLWYRVLIDRAIEHKDIEIWGDSSRVKDIVYVKDFAQMLYLAVKTDRSEGFYNVGTGVGTSLKDQIEIMAELFKEGDIKSNLIYMPEKANTPQYIMDIKPAVDELGYRPQYDYEHYLLDYRNELKQKRFDCL